METLAWIVFAVTNTIPVPFVIGTAIGLRPSGMAQLTDRLLFTTGLASCLQLCFGHRRPILEAAGGMWWGVFVSVGFLAPALGVPPEMLRRSLEGGLLAAGALGVLLGATRKVSDRVVGWFSPAMTGALLVLLAAELAPSIARAMIGVPPDARNVIVALVAFLTILFVTVLGNGLMRTASFLLGTAVGSAFAVLVHAPAKVLGHAVLFRLPTPLAFGPPLFLPGILITALLTGFLLLSNLLAAERAFAKVTGEPLSEEATRRSILVNGISNLLAGFLAVPGFVPYASTAGFVSLTGSRDPIPFLAAAIGLMLLGLVPSVGHLVVAIPIPVVYAVLLAAFAQIFAIGMADVTREGLDLGRAFIVTAPMLIGLGVMALPTRIWHSVHSPLAFVAGNGIIVGLVGVLLFLPLARLGSFGREVPRRHSVEE